MTPVLGQTAITTVSLTAVSLTVPDLRKAEVFYRDALGFEVIERVDQVDRGMATALGGPDAAIACVTMRLGHQRMDLLAFDPPGRSYPAGSTSSDLWFQHCAIVVRDMAAAHAHVSAFAITPITMGGPQTLPPNTGSVSAFKFRDPFGHPFELLHFPEGIGDPSWHRPGRDALFLGIDHTAIAVSDAAQSIAFYEKLGFTVSSRSFNSGAEQSKLDAVADASVVVVALSPAESPPHLELLAYRTGTRRPIPPHESAGDIALSRTVIEVDDLASLVAFSNDGSHPLSATASWDRRAAYSLSDPDGHRLILRERVSVEED
ncbi:VOC family protein [Lichenihabitans psoromatis]|uniref:VOC family protein n=1 Tax=Lichenihabitans psoromatis TaxID=2528642 RepID=UPI001038534C|nr:VOC family protein [Lichenihabitans psoromatis]